MNNIKTNGHLPLMKIIEVAEELKVKDENTVLKWLKKNEINIYKICGRNKVFQIDVNIAIDKMYVKGLMKTYPNTWESRYKLMAEDKIVCQMVIGDLKNENIYTTPTTKVKPLNESDNELLSKLLG